MRCPTCGKLLSTTAESASRASRSLHRPFCSERCKMADLAKWLDGAYRIAGEPVEVDQVPGAGEARKDER